MAFEITALYKPISIDCIFTTGVKSLDVFCDFMISISINLWREKNNYNYYNFQQ